MFLLRRPSAAEIARFLDASRDAPLSYGPVGILNRPIEDGRVDEQIVAIGRGAQDFDRACAALKAWKHFDLGWVELFPDRAGTANGTNVAVLIRHLGFWSLNGARIVYQAAERPNTFGFAYGTLTNHAESGEERFEVSFDPRTGDVAYRIRAVSWPQSFLARIGQPVVRMLQERFRRDSAAVMTRVVAGGIDAVRAPALRSGPA